MHDRGKTTVGGAGYEPNNGLIGSKVNMQDAKSFAFGDEF